MELAQLWCCPFSWCTVWKGTAQDCVDHMRRAHDIPPLVKVANLARWFPPCTVTRKQWHSMTRPIISGIAVDTLLFSHVGVPLFHLYRVFDRHGTHAAFRGTYMRWMHRFLEDSDAASLLHGCHGHRLGAKRTSRLMFRLDRWFIVVQFPGLGGLPRRQQWRAHRRARQRFALIAWRVIQFKL